MTKKELAKQYIKEVTRIKYEAGLTITTSSPSLKDAFIAGYEALEKENAKLQDKLKNLASVAEVRLANWQKYEKENAELKAKNKWYSEQVCNKECAEVWGKLTEAKEIMIEWKNKVCKELNEGCPGCDYCHYGEIKNKTEHFLKE